MYEAYFGKTVANHINGFKIRMNNHITENRRGLSTSKFPIHVLIAVK